VLEVNSSPGSYIEKVTDKNVAGRIIDYAELLTKTRRRKDKVGA
jgi:glutathione synthase/RimK-type ligase-like ATP-grasp enzyme